ncbi:UDP-2,4-diacetamido-2,4,6-trideoxy-beta-L-altropyranose hydrolase [Shewanella corallii]|uniref:UDP-2,4-diacetamido-2,4, 6-trideoxy-beta-L-altropyranose hydrolase n=1 Tax=Shewanella corallii TaxID=560080 RepID=A0ABT0N3N4_9GAMM|nr:UDP-2,4-diacetamido-2,4,6-trideoxy-beta-L-altropyranose hydrolase [Shewanella corallii]MCL2913062.1 UDP-2,4-diacetamido-2,4,6-trideoxy-beta-L-altropyranose hydrolase [Shewanella corallii]
MPEHHLVCYGNSSATLGSGHMMRMLAIVSWADKTNWRISFCGKYCHPAMAARLANMGFGFTELSEPLNIAQLEAMKADAIIIDDYFLSPAEWQTLVRLNCVKLALDDAIDSHPLPVDLVVNPAPNMSEADYRPRTAEASLLLGPSYTLLRPEFGKVADVEYQDRQGVLITLGGADVKQMALPLASSICELLQDADITVLLGSLNHAKLPALKALAAQYPRLTVLEHCDRVAEVMSGMALAISAAGGTLGELAAMGVPTLALCSVDNQTPALSSPLLNTWYRALDVRAYGQQDAAGDQLIMEQIREQVSDLWHKPCLRQDMSRFARQLIDVQGCSRILEALKQKL